MTAEPRWMRVARSLLGTKETPGVASNPVILNWAQRLGAKVLGIPYTADSTPWCGLFVAHVLGVSGVAVPKLAVRASIWADWGEHLERPVLGSVLVFTRKGGGHVGFYAGEDETTYHVLGGNQSDAVTLTRIVKDRLAAARWPRGEPMKSFGPAMVHLKGSISRNER